MDTLNGNTVRIVFGVVALAIVMAFLYSQGAGIIALALGGTVALVAIILAVRSLL